MRWAVLFIINGLGSLILPARPCAGLVPVIYRRELIKNVELNQELAFTEFVQMFNQVLNFLIGQDGTPRWHQYRFVD